MQHCSRQNSSPAVQCFSAKQAHSLHFVTVVTSMQICSSYRCHVMRKPCYTGQPSRLFNSPWFDSRCVVLRFQLQRTKQLSGLRQEFRLLQPRYQRQFRLSKATNNQQDVLSLSQLFETYPRQFWCKASLPHHMLPAELQTPAAWNGQR